MSKAKELFLWVAGFLFFLLSLALTVVVLACLRVLIQVYNQWPNIHYPTLPIQSLGCLLVLLSFSFFTVKAFGASKKAGSDAMDASLAYM